MKKVLLLIITIALFSCQTEPINENIVVDYKTELVQENTNAVKEALLQIRSSGGDVLCSNADAGWVITVDSSYNYTQQWYVNGNWFYFAITSAEAHASCACGIK